MALSKKPTTGMKDILPEEMQIRDYVISVIKDTYGKFGFTSIETPCVENIANLSSKQGGDNEKLIFKILKRGEKLNVAAATTEEEVVDSGLHYDLSFPDLSAIFFPLFRKSPQFIFFLHLLVILILLVSLH